MLRFALFASCAVAALLGSATMSRASAAPCLTGPSATFAYTGQETSCTIVTGGTYEITAWGGTGGVAVGRNDAGGLPARLSILASLASNTDLTLLVGGAGSNGNPVDFIAGGGGGGGSFVVSGKTPILVAGGGGGGGSFNGGAGQIGTSGGNGGSNLIGVTGGSGGSLGRGGGAPSSGGGGGGGGLSGSGGGSGGGVSFIGGGAGGAAQYYAAGAGGFGGGGGGGKYSSGGGGGGYSGGGAGYGNYGGGGGSFAVAGSTVLSAQSGYAAPTSDGEIILTAVPTPEPASAALLGIGLAALGLTTVRGRRSLRAT